MEAARSRAHSRAPSIVKASASDWYSSEVMRPHTIFKWHLWSARAFWACATTWRSSASSWAGEAVCVGEAASSIQTLARSSVTTMPSASTR